MFKVRFKRAVDRFPHFLVPPGATGQLVLLTEKEAAVKLDVPLHGCEDWDNKVYWDNDCDSPVSDMALDLEVLPTLDALLVLTKLASNPQAKKLVEDDLDAAGFEGFKVDDVL